MTISTDINLSYYIFGNLTFASRGIKSPANQLRVKQFIQDNVTDNIKAPHFYTFMCENHYWPLVPLPKGQLSSYVASEAMSRHHHELCNGVVNFENISVQ